jgi:hypothetical protein
MPKYAFEIDGQKYTVTSDVQPTREQLLELVKQQQKPSEPTIQPFETEQKVKQTAHWSNPCKPIRMY